MNNATLETMTAERDSLRAAFIRYIALDQFIGCGCNPDDFDAHFENMQDAFLLHRRRRVRRAERVRNLPDRSRVTETAPVPPGAKP